MMPNFSRFIILTMTMALAGVSEAGESKGVAPAGFRLIGHYELNSKLRVERGQSTPVIISPLRYQVYSDGIDVRVYCSVSGEETYTAYQIYRSDGIGVVRDSGEIDLVAGVQGFCRKGEMVRQVSVTRNSLTMVKMPPRSHRVIITRAVSVAKTPVPASAKRPSWMQSSLSEATTPAN